MTSSFWFGRGTLDGVLDSMEFQKQRTRRVEGPLMSAASAQKALQGSKTDTRELLGGTEEHERE